MLSRLRLLIPVAALLSACGGAGEGPAAKTPLEVIDSLETVLFADDGAMADREAAILLVRQYATYYRAHPADSLAIDMLFKAGEVSMGLGDGRMAVKYLSTVAEEHSAFHRAPEALFLSGFCEENINADLQQAEYFYTAFIERYPDHALTEDARFSIANLGMSDEDLIRLFEQGAGE